MKNLKKEIRDLLSGKEGKQDIIIFDDFNCEPGFYRHNGHVITLFEKEKLEKGCQRSITFILAKGKIIDNESVSDKNHLTILVDKSETTETFLKLRNIKKK